MAHRTLASGTLLAKRYRVERLIKAGGFAAVYVAVDMLQHKRCAVKETFDPSVEGADQFRLEAEILAGVRHPNLPAVWDYFQHSGGLYLVMEFIEGEDLESQLEIDEFLDEPRVRDWAIQICDALTELHLHDPPIIHRDIKPANIKITPEGRAVLVDFGIAKLYREGNNTQVAARAVTDGFSPLEQYGQGSTDARSDIYAMGATLYNLLTGVIPPDAPNRVTEETLVPPRSLKPGISPAMELLVIRALSVRPSERFQSAEELRQALVATAVPPRTLSEPFGQHNSHPTGQREGKAGPWWCASCQAKNSAQNGFCAQCGAPAPTIEIDLLEMPTRMIPPVVAPAEKNIPHIIKTMMATRGWEVVPGTPNAVLTAVAGGPERGLVACGERGLVLVHHRDVWVPLPAPTAYALRAVVATTSNVWAVGDFGTVVHFTGGRWMVLPHEGEETLRSIALTGPASGWIVGVQGSLIELRDQQLVAAVQRPYPLHAVVTDEQGNGWAVGQDNTILRLSQGVWKSRGNALHLGSFNGIAHLRAGVAWAVGSQGVLLRVDETGWEVGPTLGLPDLHAVAFNRANEGWAVGDHGAVAWFDGESWTVATPVVGDIMLRSVAWLHDDEAWAVGDHGEVLRWRR